MGDLTISIVSHGHGDLLVFLLQDIADHVPDAEVIVTLNIPEPSLELSAIAPQKGLGQTTTQRSAPLVPIGWPSSIPTSG
jgi:hypothetical protein